MDNTIRLVKINNGSASSPDISGYSLEAAQKVISFHKSIPEYAPTPLISLQQLAEYFNVGNIYVKDESTRFGLNAFKALGGSYAMHKVSEETDRKLTFITATDGNHGRGVAWAAQRLGHHAYVYLPRGTVRERLDNISRLGAYAEVTDMLYDDTVKYAASLAKKNNWILLQDTAWDGYETIPSFIMQGYTTMGIETVEQLSGNVPTHIFLQAGVGSMAAAMTAFFRNYYLCEHPKIIIVEPCGADCIFRTAVADDGLLHKCDENMSSIMAGLCCGEPCSIAWGILHRYADYALAVPDTVAANGMRILANPIGDDSRIISGESGASTVGAFAEIMNSSGRIREELQLSKESVLLFISTEGDTDKENYRNIVWYGNCGDMKELS